MSVRDPELGTPPDLIVWNAAVWLGEQGPNSATAVVARGGRIVAIGRDEDVLALSGVRTKVVDGRSRTLLPGFVDSHVHLLGCAETYFSVDCSPSQVTSVAELQNQIRDRAAQTPEDGWIRAHGYHQSFLDGGRHPTRWDLDAAAPQNPVRLLHQNRHLSVLNSLGLRAAGITRHTKNPPGAIVDKDPTTGEPTGLLVGMNSWLSRQVIPRLEPGALAEGVRLACQSFLSQGVTCIHDASPHNGIGEWRLYGRLAGSGDLPLQVRVMAGLDGLNELDREEIGPGRDDRRLRLGAVKLIVEEIGDRLHPSPSELTAQVQRVHGAGDQLAVHAITPRAIQAVVRAFKSLGEGEARRRRHRIEHCTYLPSSLLAELAEIGAVIVGQPSFLFYNGRRYLSEVPIDKFAWICRGKSLLSRNIPLAGSTDAPVVPNSIFAAIAAAVTRESQVGFVFGPREKISLAQGIALFTTGGAYAGFEEEEIGAIRVGGHADLVLVNRNLSQVQPEEIGNVRPVMTIVGGEVAWMGED